MDFTGGGPLPEHQTNVLFTIISLHFHTTTTITPLLSLKPQGVSMKREFRVCDEGDNLHVREDICKGADAMSHKENRIPKKFASK